MVLFAIILHFSVYIGVVTFLLSLSFAGHGLTLCESQDVMGDIAGDKHWQLLLRSGIVLTVKGGRWLQNKQVLKTVK